LRKGAIATAYANVIGMPVSQVEGHHGRFVAGGLQLDGCILLEGRSHLYEGYSLEEVTFAVHVLRQLGVRTLVLTNAAGSMAEHLRPGNLMMINDHLSLIDFSELQPLLKPPAIVQRSRQIWSERLSAIAAGLATPLQVHSGCYAMMSGPNYETPAEIRMLIGLGADAVGMSTVPEAICASQLGMEVLGVSCITNAAAGLSDVPLSHQDVFDTAGRVENDFVDWLHQLLAAI